jgi:hypothetical protein
MLRPLYLNPPLNLKIGPELMEKFITQETDMSARRNAFLMLFNEAEHIAIDFLTEHIDDIQKYGDGFALLVLELTRKVQSLNFPKKSCETVLKKIRTKEYRTSSYDISHYMR